MARCILAAIVGDRRRRPARRRRSSRRLWRPLRRRGDQPDVDDDRVDRHRHRRALPLPVLLRRRPQARTASTSLQPEAVSHRADRPRRRATLSIIGPVGRRHRRRGAVPAARPLRQGDPRGVRQPRPGVGDAASTPTVSSSSSGCSAARSPASAACCYGLESASVGHGLHPAAADVRGDHRSAGSATRSARWSARWSSACSSSCGPGSFPNANDLKNVGALVALIVVLLIRPQGILGSEGADRMNWGSDLLERALRRDQRQRRRPTA